MGIFSLWIFGNVSSLGAVGLICLRHGFYFFFALDIMCVHWFMVFFIIFDMMWWGLVATQIFYFL